MTFFDFADAHPFLLGFLALVAGVTLFGVSAVVSIAFESVAGDCSKAWAKVEEKRNKRIK